MKADKSQRPSPQRSPLAAPDIPKIDLSGSAAARPKHKQSLASGPPIIRLKQVFIASLLDGKKKTDVMTALRRAGASAAELMALAQDPEVLHAADCAWSLQALLMAPKALKGLSDLMIDDDSPPSIKLSAAKEILSQARRFSQHQLDILRLGRPRPGNRRNEDDEVISPVEVEVDALADLIGQARDVVSGQNGTSSSAGSEGRGVTES